jgi:hypothetical protein
MCMSVTFGHTLALREGGYTVQKVTVQFTPRSTFVEASVIAGKALSTPADAGDFAFSGRNELPPRSAYAMRSGRSACRSFDGVESCDMGPLSTVYLFGSAHGARVC